MRCLCEPRQWCSRRNQAHLPIHTSKLTGSNGFSVVTDWRRVKGVVPICVCLKNRLQTRISEDSSTTDKTRLTLHHEIFNKEIKLLRYCATGGEYPNGEVTRKRIRSTKQTSSFYRFERLICIHSILHFGGRITRANISDDVKYLDILLITLNKLDYWW